MSSGSLDKSRAKSRAKGSSVQQAKGSSVQQAKGSFVELGQIVGVWGVKGWVKLHSYTRNRADIAEYSTWWLQSPKKNEQPELVNVVSCREQGQGIVAQLEGVNDRDQANALKGRSIMVKQADMPKLSEGEYYWQELIGLTVSNKHKEIGVVSSILETGANDVLVVKQVVKKNDGGGDAKLPEVLIPYTPQVVEQVDVAQGTMIVDWDPDFLLES